MNRYRLNIAYDGSEYQGWQVQPDARTVQGELERVLAELFGGETIRLHGSGRTDTGVHAVGQVAHADLPMDRATGKLKLGLNGLLPASIRVWRVTEVGEEFHARYSATERWYCYRVLKEESPFLERFGWYVRQPLDLTALREAAAHMLGEHDFRPFSTQPFNDQNTRCAIRQVQWDEDADGLLFRIAADRFLRRMVRTIVGTLVEVGSGMRSAESVQTLVRQGAGRAGVPAPPQGLALMRVHYDIDNLDDRPGPSPWGEIA